MTSANEKNGIRTKCDNLLDVFHNVQTWDDRNDLRQEHIPPLEVPDFQRPYEWPAHMVISFTAKLFETYKLQDTDDTSTSTHFASTVFLHLDKNPSRHCPLNNRWRALILDGQQRLITLTLILLVLKDRLSQFHSQIKRKNSSSPSAADDEFYEQMDEMIGKLNTRIFCKPSSRISVPRLTAHPDQQEPWCGFLKQNGATERMTWVYEPEELSTEIFLDNYKAISETLDTLIEEYVFTGGEQTRAKTDAKEKQEMKVFYDFSDKLLTGLVQGVQLIRTGSIHHSLRMLAGINAPGKPLDPVAHLKFHLRGKRTDDDCDSFKSFVKSLGSAATSSSVLVASCALLSDIKIAAEEITDPITILMKSLESFVSDSSSRSVEDEVLSDDPIFFSVGSNSSTGLNAEENYWYSAISIAQYLEKIEVNASSNNSFDRALMPLLALSNIKPNTDKSLGRALVDTSSSVAKTLRLFRCVLVAAVLTFKGSVESGNLNIIHGDQFKKFLLGLEVDTLYNLFCKRHQKDREEQMINLIQAKLKLLNKGIDSIYNCTVNNELTLKLLIQLHEHATIPQDPMIDAGKSFAVLLSCQSPSTYDWRFDGLNGNFEIEHIVAKESKDETVSMSLKENKCLHRLGNLCLLENDINSSASNKGFLDKKDLYNRSEFYVPRKLSGLAGILPPSSWDFNNFSNRHQEMLCFLHKRLIGKPPDDPNIYKISNKFFDLTIETTSMTEGPPNRNINITDNFRTLIHSINGRIIADNCPKAFSKSFSKVSREEFLAVKHIMLARHETGNGGASEYILSEPSKVALGRHFGLFEDNVKPELEVSNNQWGYWKSKAEEWWKKNGGEQWTAEQTRSGRHNFSPPRRGTSLNCEVRNIEDMATVDEYDAEQGKSILNGGVSGVLNDEDIGVDDAVIDNQPSIDGFSGSGGGTVRRGVRRYADGEIVSPMSKRVRHETDYIEARDFRSFWRSFMSEVFLDENLNNAIQALMQAKIAARDANDQANVTRYENILRLINEARQSSATDGGYALRELNMHRLLNE